MNSAHPGHSSTPRAGRIRTVRSCVAVVALLAAPGACGRIGFTLLDVSAADGGPDEHHDATLADVGAAHDAQSFEASSDDAEDAGADAGADAGDDADADAGQPSTDAAADAGDGGCVTSSIVNYCTELPFLPAPPVIDGVLECGPALLPMVPVGWNGPGVVPAGNSAKVAAAWRPDGLYVYAEIACPQLIIADPGEYAWEGNGVELYVDNDGVFPQSPLYDDAGTTVQLVTEAPDSSTSTSTTGEIWRNAVYASAWTTNEFELHGTPTGYTLEAFIEAPDLDLTTWSLAAGGMVGFNLAVNVAYASPTTTGNDGHRLGQFFLYVGPPPDGYPFGDVRSFCTPTLSP